MTAEAAFAAKLGHEFARPELLAQALTHSSATQGSRLSSNERLEFVGDRVLGLIVAEWLVERFPAEREGDLGKRLSALISAEALAGIAERLDLAAALKMPESYRQQGFRTWVNILSDALEAVLGAIYLDGGLEAARGFVRREWSGLLEEHRKPPLPAKSRLQEWTLGRGLGLPVYVLTSSEGPAHSPVFKVTVAAAGREAEGEGATKRAAEQAAAEAWLAGLKRG
ncbi:ribonuclease III [Paracraurococcus ruber]|uniref:Ribonuclease 3 n=1 Tax=Paracraurococcus ruber TaxID=77675 RepID=A0ABS1D758_9PROT|nr:ribonuclease III [Paracraurococcus ruber]MBK1662664.1 ribonuclease III [Paracraurococcus ruber]TDG13227.1 ribonuclease III [Paracraurococcus ruber]